ncbi:hypothetical protein Q8A67_025145 [Cirrhinus molitorella]|uniref:Uncharacterized protein n=1 Tax=Cirrhinus molitorella TaxID=172907 RepID=A0AA88T9F0_9TELE|nr:hypothetical protein Q8A67_025145 [Cirrhinus molitorella]
MQNVSVSSCGNMLTDNKNNNNNKNSRTYELNPKRKFLCGKSAHGGFIRHVLFPRLVLQVPACVHRCLMPIGTTGMCFELWFTSPQPENSKSPA